ncbi:MAG: hypothetical protein JKX91_06090 [Rhizobiaceae bacterium]|nr:hypothetical protein [Rhizobiaceae bacterium]
MLKILLASCMCLIGLSQVAIAGDSDVVGVKVRASSSGFGFDVTLRHGDEGRGHYADRWEIVGPDGTVYGARILLHPHENEQPFTRSKSGVKIPVGVKSVEIRAGAKPHGLGGKTMHVNLPGR